MTKRLPPKSTSEVKGQGGAERLWPLIAVAFGALVVVSFLAPVDSVSVFFGAALPQNLGWLSLAALSAFASRRSLIQVRPRRTELVIVGCGLAWLVAVTWVACGHGNGRAVWNGFWQVMSLASCFYIGRALLQFAEIRASLILILLIGCTAMALVGMEQVLVSLPAARAEYVKDPNGVLAENDIDAPPGSPRRTQFENRLNSPEPFANFALANSLAALLCLGVLLTGGSLANSILRDAKIQKNKLLRWSSVAGLSIALLLQLICLLLTRSRTAYLSILLALGFWLLLEWLQGKLRLTGRTLQMIGLAVGAFALVGFGWLLTVDRLVWSEAPKSISYRLEYWQATLAMIRDYAWTGVGLGNFQAYYPQYKLEQASEIIADPHNWMLDVAVTLSVPIAVLAISWVGITVGKGIAACLNESGVSGVAIGDHETAIATKRDRQLARWLAIGAASGGGLSAVLLALTSSFNLPTNLIAGGLSSALVGLAWRSGTLKPSASNMVAAVIAVVLCLLSSGSWQASGVAVPLLCLMAIHWQWPSRPTSPSLSLSSVDQAQFGGVLGWLTPLLAAASVMIFVLQAWRPVTESWILAENALAAPTIVEKIRLSELASSADPLDENRKVQKLQLLAAKANEASDSAVFEVEAANVLRELKQVSPPDVVGFLMPKLAGEISSQMASVASRHGLPNQEYLKAARGFYRLAVERYPSSVELLVQHAAVSALAEDWQEAAESIEKATLISDRTPHLDKKLAAQLIWLPLKPTGFEPTGFESTGFDSTGFDSTGDYVSAEPLVDWLRTEIKAKLR